MFIGPLCLRNLLLNKFLRSVNPTIRFSNLYGICPANLSHFVCSSLFDRRTSTACNCYQPQSATNLMLAAQQQYIHACACGRPWLYRMAHFKVQGLSASTTNASVVSRLRKRAPLFLGLNTILPLSRSQYPCNRQITVIEVPAVVLAQCACTAAQACACCPQQGPQTTKHDGGCAVQCHISSTSLRLTNTMWPFCRPRRMAS
jgi:hypothetical protein